MSVRRTVTDIQAALAAVLATITEDNGYSITLRPENIIVNNPSEELPVLTGDDSISNFPRASMVLFGEEYAYLPSRRVHKTATWYVGISLLALGEELDLLTAKVQAAINDMEKAMMLHYTLGGAAIQAEIEESAHDYGFIDSGLGIILFRIRVKYEASRAA